MWKRTSALWAALNLACGVAMAAGSCDSPDGLLPPPLLDTCQYVTGNFGDPQSYYEIDLQEGRRYEFTTCNRECPDARILDVYYAWIQLYDPDCALVASDPNQPDCRYTSDNSLVYVAPCSGRYVVSLHSPFTRPGPDWSLGYVEACATPHFIGLQSADVSFSPGCESQMALRFYTDGDGPFTWSWSARPTAFWPLPEPPTGTLVDAGPVVDIVLSMAGEGSAFLDVEVTNGCGTTRNPITLRFHDRQPPTVEASVVECDPATVVMRESREATRPDPPAPVRTPPPPECEPPCPTPCTAGVLALDSNPFYEAFVRCETGELTLRTGASHPLTARFGRKVPLLAGGEAGAPIGARLLWEAGGALPWQPLPGASACMTNPADTPEEIDSVAIEVTWRHRPDPLQRDAWLRQHVVIYGDSPENAGVLLGQSYASCLQEQTLNSRVSASWWLDVELPGDPGPELSWQDCWRAERTDPITTVHAVYEAERREHDVLRLDANDGPGGAALLLRRRTLGWEDRGQVNVGFVAYATPDQLRDCQNRSCMIMLPEGAAGPDVDAALGLFFEEGRGVMEGNDHVEQGYMSADGLRLRAIDPGEDCGPFDPGGDATIVTCAPACVRLDAAASDPCEPVTFAPHFTPPGAPPCPTLPCEVTLAAPGSYTYAWSATDDSLNVRRASATIHVLPDAECNRPPTCAPGAARRVSCESVVMAELAVEDAEGDPVTWRWETDDPRLTIVPTSGTTAGGSASSLLPATSFTVPPGTPTCGLVIDARLVLDDGRHPREYSCAVPVSFHDDVSPRLVGAPTSAPASCAAVPLPPLVTAEDDCARGPAVTFGERVVPGDCPGRYTIVRTWVATDDCGNRASHEQLLDVSDTAGPVVAEGSRDLHSVWPPNHRMTCFRRADFVPGLADDCSPPSTWRFVGCASDQPDETDSARTPGDGNAPGDCVVSSDGSEICVRAERAGGVPGGRRYAVTIVGTDACGNDGGAATIGYVHVPHDSSAR